MHIMTILLAGLVSTAPDDHGTREISVERAARQFRINAYDSYRNNRSAYDRARNAGDELLEKWHAAGRPSDYRQEIVQWYHQAASGNIQSSLPRLPEVPASLSADSKTPPVTTQVVAGAPGVTPLPIGMNVMAATRPEQPHVRDSLPLAVVSFSGYDRLQQDIDLIGKLSGRPYARQIFDGMIGAYTAGKGLAGLDTTKPWGAALFATDFEVVPVGFVPVHDLPALLEALQAVLPARTREVEPGIHRVSLGSNAVFVGVRDGYAFIARKPEELSLAPADPRPLLGKLPERYDLALHVNVQQIPRQFRAGITDRLFTRIDGHAAQMATQPGGNDLSSLFDDAQQVTLGWNFDNSADTAYLDLLLTPNPGSELAGRLAAAQENSSRFNGFILPGCASARFTCSAIGQEEIKQAQAAVQLMRDRWSVALDQNAKLTELSRQQIRLILDQLTGELSRSIEAGQIDVGAAMKVTAGSASFAAGLQVADGTRAERALQKLANAAGHTTGIGGIEWNALSIAGINFHRFDASTTAGPADRLSFDTSSFLFGLNEDRVYLAGGTDAEELIQAALERSNQEAPDATPLLHVSMSLGNLNAAVPSNVYPSQFLEIWQQFSGRDHLNITVRGVPQGVRVRAEFETGALEALGEVIGTGVDMSMLLNR